MAEQSYKWELVAGRNDIAVIELGNMVMGGSDALEFSSLLNELNNKNTRYVIVDMAHVKLINSSGLGMLVAGLTTLKKNDMQLLLTDIPEKVHNLFVMTHLDRVFSTFQNVYKAIEACK